MRARMSYFVLIKTTVLAIQAMNVGIKRSTVLYDANKLNMI